MYVLVDISISSEEYLRWYRGSANAVVATAKDGRKIRFPAQSLQQFVTHSGVHGTFAVYFDDYHKLLRVEKLAD